MQKVYKITNIKNCFIIEPDDQGRNKLLNSS